MHAFRMKNMDQKQVSYALGLGIGQNLLGMGAKDIIIDEFAHGVKDVLEGKKLEIDHKTAQIIVSQYIDELDKKMTVARQEANKQFLDENKKREGVVELPSGLQYYVVNKGNVDGKRAKETDRVQCHYEGRLLDGNVFDSSYQRGEPSPTTHARRCQVDTFHPIRNGLRSSRSWSGNSSTQCIDFRRRITENIIKQLNSKAK